MAEPDQGRREARIGAFIARTGWAAAERLPLAGDASDRRYLRLRLPDRRSAVLMDAPVERGEDVRPFLRIARHLAELGFSPPAILDADVDGGLLLLEDLGDDLFARVLQGATEGEALRLYTAATDLLAELHRHPAPSDAPAYDAAEMGARSALAVEWYMAGAVGDHSGTAAERNAFAALITGLCTRLTPDGGVLALRDYHAENLIWLPLRKGHARVGLLDFQDAAICHPAYDLVSLLQDARRDVPGALQEAMLNRYAQATGQGIEALSTVAACLGAQRNLRILGVFARLCMRDGKPAYLRHIPRVWRYLMQDLAHPALKPLEREVARLLPAPEPAILSRIASLCPTVPTR